MKIPGCEPQLNQYKIKDEFILLKAIFLDYIKEIIEKKCSALYLCTYYTHMHNWNEG